MKYISSIGISHTGGFEQTERWYYSLNKEQALEKINSSKDRMSKEGFERLGTYTV